MRIYLIGAADPNLTTRLVRASNRHQALNHVAQSLFNVRVASQDDLVAYVAKGIKVEMARDGDQLKIEGAE
jgi:hypothetical protein